VEVALAGYLVERINPGHLSFEQYCQQYIFDPLGMNNSSFFLANLNLNDIAVPYAWNGSSFVPYQHYGAPYYPVGWLRTSTSQLARFLIAFMQHGQIEGTRILDSSTVELMTTVQLPGPVWGGYGWGLLWTSKTFGGRTIWGHMGNSEGCETEMWYSPDENTGAIVLTNGESTWGSRYILNEIFEYANSPVPPAAPQALVILIANGEAQLSWQPSAGATIYHIYGSTTPDGPGILLMTVNTTTWTDPDYASRPSPFFFYVTAE